MSKYPENIPIKSYKNNKEGGNKDAVDRLDDAHFFLHPIASNTHPALRQKVKKRLNKIF